MVDILLTGDKMDKILSERKLSLKNVKNIDIELGKYLSENLNEKIKKLKAIPCSCGLGTVYDSIERLTELSNFVCLWIPHCDLINVRESAKLSKMGLTSDILKNNPKIIGFLSAYYAKILGCSDDICNAIEELYEKEPKTNVAKAIFIAKKMDDITAFFIAKNKKSLKEFNLIKKNALTIIRLILDNNIDIKLNILIHKSISLFKTSSYKKNRNSKISIKQQILKIENEIIRLFKECFVDYTNTFGYSKKIINSVVEFDNKKITKKFDNLNVLCKKIACLNDFVKNDKKKFLTIKQTYKNLSEKLLNFETGKIKFLIKNILSKKYFKSSELKVFSKKIKEIKKEIKKENENENYKKCLELLYELNSVLKEYFDCKCLKGKNQKLSGNNLFLLYKVKSIFDSFVNFSFLV